MVERTFRVVRQVVNQDRAPLFVRGKLQLRDARVMGAVRILADETRHRVHLDGAAGDQAGA